MTSRKSLLGRRIRWIFHEASKNFQVGEQSSSDSSSPPDTWKSIDYKQYDTSTTITLDNRSQRGTSLQETIGNRRSPGIEELEQIPLTVEDLSFVVGEAAGITKRGETQDSHWRAYPSGGAQYPLEVYIVVLKGGDVEEGLYHYNVLENSLEQLRTEDIIQELDFFAKDIRQTASGVAFVSAKLERSTTKYGERGYRYAHIEAGHLMQNMCLLAEQQELACHPYGGFIEDQADEYIKIHTGSETTLYTGILGGK